MKREVMAKRFRDAILEMYNSAENITGNKMHFDSYDELISYCIEDPRDAEKYNKRKMIPYDSFILEKEKQDEIISRATKGCRYVWIWPNKIPIGGDRKFDKYIKELNEYEKNKKNITRWFRKKKQLEIAKKYKLQWRSREAEGLSFEIWNINPTYSMEHFNKIKEVYNLYLKGKEIDHRYDLDMKAIDGFVKAYNKNHVES